ncbi:MAG: 2Fe-2S ferredoxin [Pseudomonadota bacterium]|jgi:2Fe-2S ferredoxin
MSKDCQGSSSTFQVTFVSPSGERREVQVAAGESSSLLEIALSHDIEMDHACGGVCACSTCHVKIKEGLRSCSESTEEEEDQLDEAPGLTAQSRLACQCIPSGTEDLVVEIPSWNRNRVREGA